MENISISNSESFGKSQPQTLPIVYQTSLSANSKQNRLSGSSKELLISTSPSNNSAKAELNSPTPSSASSASSTSSSSVALINDTSISALPAQSTSSSSSNSTYELVEQLAEDHLAKANAKNKSRDVEFKFFYEFYYKLKRPSLSEAIYENDSDDRPYTLNSNENYFNMGYNDTIRLLVANYVKSSSYALVEHLLDPILVDLISANESSGHQASASSANFYFKFTIDFYKAIASNRLNLVSASKSTSNYISGLNKANFELDYKLANSADLSLMSGSEFNLSIVKDLFGGVDCFAGGSGSNGVGMDDSFILIKNKLKSLLIKRLSYLNEQLEISSKSVDLNNKLGNKVNLIVYLF